RGVAGAYLAPRRVAAKPAVARRTARRIIAHCESVGVAMAPPPGAPAGGTVNGGTVPPVHMLIALLSIVTVPFRASARPCRFALVARVMLVSAMMLPCIALKVPIEAELPTCHQTSQGVAPLMRLTADAPGPEAVTSDVVWKT